MKQQLYIGLMSGTSLDGVDAVIVDLNDNFPKIVASYMEPLPVLLREQLLALTQPGDNEIDRLGIADIQFADLQIKAIKHLLAESEIHSSDIRAIGSHGQTIRHRPDLETPFSLQIGDPNRMAEQLGIQVVNDFRRRDIAAGGQGAPLVPAFHERFLRSENQDRIVLNIGGISNVTILEKDLNAPVTGYDPGPGNILMDAWIQRHLGHAYDHNGAWAQSGTINDALLNLLLDTPYLKQPPPKSTGRELFHIGWLDKHLQNLEKPITPADVQATLLEFTACSIAEALLQHQFGHLEIFLCGGGVHNQALRQRLEELLSAHYISTTDTLGLPSVWLEACAFAWLAQACIEGNTGNLPSVTGARGKRILGAIYQA